jgi:hypothetical protein
MAEQRDFESFFCFVDAEQTPISWGGLSINGTEKRPGQANLEVEAAKEVVLGMLKRFGL